MRWAARESMGDSIRVVDGGKVWGGEASEGKSRVGVGK